MKILLLGEFSYLHSSLKSGLEKLGHDVTLLSSGEGYKKIKGDITIDSMFTNKYLKEVETRLKYLYWLPQFRGYDIVQYIQSWILPLPHAINILYLKFLKRFNGKVFLNISGGDAYVITYALANLRYSAYSAEIKAGKYDGTYKMLGYNEIKKSLRLSKLFNGIISSSYSYHIPYMGFKNYFGFIPMPIEIPSYCLKNEILGKIKIFHGITRREIKGTNFILKALEDISLKYPYDVEIQVVEKVSFADYHKLFESCNIFIDQASSYDYGMNALLALSRGKVVMSGCEKETNELVGGRCPVINITPNSESIFYAIEELILKRENISIIGERGYYFVKEHHDHVKVASQYIHTWNQYLK